LSPYKIIETRTTKKVSSSGFQIKAVDAMPCVLWAVARYWKDPEDCIIRTVGFGNFTPPPQSHNWLICPTPNPLRNNRRRHGYHRLHGWSYGTYVRSLFCPSSHLLPHKVGALHGSSWIPTRWFDNLENQEWGRDYLISVARRLAQLDLHVVTADHEEVLSTAEEEAAPPPDESEKHKADD